MNESSQVTRSKADARANYNRLSRLYDWFASSEARYRQMGVALLAVKPGEKVLEIGFGTGHCLLAFARGVGDSGWVGGLDLSDGMAVVARGRLQEAGMAGRVGLSLADGCQVPFPKGYFEAVFMSFTLELFDTPEIPQVLGECRRILKPQGRLVLVSLVKSKPPKMAERIYEWFHARMPVLVDCRPIEALTCLTGAGFSIETVLSETMWGLPVAIIRGIKS